MKLASEALTSAVRTMGNSTTDAVRIRRRAMATGGFILFIAAFLFTVGLRQTAVVVLLVAGGLAAAAAVAYIVFRARPDVRAYARRARGVGGSVGTRAARGGAGAVRMGVAGGAGAVRLGTAGARRGGHAAEYAQSRLTAGSRQREAVRLNARGAEHRRRGRYQQALADHERALSLMQESGDSRGEAMTENSLALALAQSGEDGPALEHFERSLAILSDLEDVQSEGRVLANVGFVHSRRGRRPEALGCLNAALRKLSPESSAYRRVEEQLRRAS
jgi:tetratricopeptide (TPR) repeat protein